MNKNINQIGELASLNTQETEVFFRPHHFLCTLCYQGKGYSNEFIKNYNSITTILKSAQGNNIQIQIVPHSDSICSPCPHRVSTNCSTEEKISILDKAHAKALSLKNMRQISWGEVKTRIFNSITLEKFHQICAPCDWKKYKFCENALSEFLKESS